MTDISHTLAPNSDQLDAVDLLGGPRTFTVTGVSVTKGEQPVSVQLAEFPRVWRPGKTMRRVLAFCWGNDSSTWTGKRVTLYCDPKVRFGPEEVGGTRISHLSGISGPTSVPVIVSKGKGGTFKVQPLPDAPPPSREQELLGEYPSATPERQAEIKAEVEAIRAGGAPNGA